ncbi:hypothetical protein GII36_00440 [Candidatus Mycosynbacter amalyticus]|uniref:Uncharacterized protein n=1 Tax=Candidatus Mycosynbacter amalyticus TaxID=2665156 RepID=A0A857MS94_9BACT|nr:hypothetical protein [Candidatus Mycosynbacter amalyticus]QHN42327.1 hypothetical protein GII36_00440 [Candidatus Mycosynbacter amalyticus]
MKFFKIVRLSLWCVIIASCIAIITLNYSITKVVSDASSLRKITRSANTYEIVRGDILTPRILAEAQDTGYGALVDEKVVRTAVDKSFDDDNLDKLLVPATESMANWLGSKQPDATFRVDAQQQLTELADSLAAEMTAKILAQPICNYTNTSADIATGQCRLSILSEKEIRAGILVALKSQPTIKEGVLSSDQLTIPNSVISQTRNIPEYLNMLNSAAIFAAGIFALSSLWLLIKHRFRGVAVIGIGGLLAALTVFIAQGSGVAIVNSYVLEPGYQELARALAAATAAEMRMTLLPLAGASALLTVIGFVGWYLIRRRRSTQHEKARVHFGESKSDIDNTDA